MSLERVPPGANVIDVLDRVLDKGIVMDALIRVSVGGIDLVTIEARVVVASIETYLGFGGTLGGFAETTSGDVARESPTRDRTAGRVTSAKRARRPRRR